MSRRLNASAPEVVGPRDIQNGLLGGDLFREAQRLQLQRLQVVLGGAWLLTIPLVVAVGVLDEHAHGDHDVLRRVYQERQLLVPLAVGGARVLLEALGALELVKVGALLQHLHSRPANANVEMHYE